jgi:hypothetical protein
VDPVQDPLILRKSGTARNRTRTSGSLARNSDHETTEAVNDEGVIKINIHQNHGRCLAKWMGW